MSGLGDLSPNASRRELIREARRRDIRVQIELLQGQLAKSHDERTKERIRNRIRIAQGRLSRA